MEFTESNPGDKAIVNWERRLVASHEGSGVWRVRRLPDMSDYCLLHSGSSDAKPVWSPHDPHSILFFSESSVLLFHLEQRHADNATRGPGQPDGVIKECLLIERAFFGTGSMVVVVLANRMGVRLWDTNKQHEPWLSVTGRYVISDDDPALNAIVVCNKYLLVRFGDECVSKWKLPDGAILDGFMFVRRDHVLEGCKYGLIAWQSEESFQVYTCDDVRGFVMVAADDSIFGIDNVQYQGDLLAFTDRTGCITLFNVLTKNLVNKVAVDLEDIKKRGTVVVFRECRSSGQSEGAWFDAGYGELLGGGAVIKNGQIEPNLSLRSSFCNKYLAIRSLSYPNLLFIFSVSKQDFPAVLLLTQPISSFSWHKTDPLVVCSSTNSPFIYTWQPEGARALPHPHGPVDAVEWIDDWCLIRGKKMFSVAIPILD